jgi:phosphopentomutase
MATLGLAKAYENNMGKQLKLLQTADPIKGAFYGAAKEQSAGKDTLSGHWEMAGVAMDLEMVYFPDTQPTFPAEMIAEIISRSDIEEILGDRHASGLEVIESLGEEHIRTGYPIFYTSADSVLQIAAHEEYFGLERLYKLCQIAREVTDSYGVGRVIARPFIGERAETFERTKNRHDYAMRPSGKSVLEIAVEQGYEVIGIGKIHDIFGGHGVSTKIPAYKLEGLMDATLVQIEQAGEGSIIMTNFVDFDMEWGHRRDVEGYAKGLEYFDRRLPEVLKLLGEDDLLILTADHGCDPTWSGTDHTREYVPVFGMLKSHDIGDIGLREGFADMAASISEHLGIPMAEQGTSFLNG